MNARSIQGEAVARKDDGIVRPDDVLTRKQAAHILGMNDTEFALRLIWDAAFPKPVEGAFREADILAWMKAQGRKVVSARS
jgi:predicted DNA-binding transcriptional regulator AlpA